MQDYSIKGYNDNILLADDPVALGKQRIYYTAGKGRFLKKCPGTLSGYICCNYYVFNIQANCNFDCQYCILQDYIKDRRITVYTNIDNALKEVKDFLRYMPARFYRIGTGELTDSLSLDNITNTSLELVPFFAKLDNALLELKTKSNNIGNLLKIQAKKNIVVSWSLNPQSIIDRYEKGSVSFSERLRAAIECYKAGYSVGFHLDPVILYSGWEEEYRDIISRIFNGIPQGGIIWMSIAGFRYTQGLKAIIQERFPKTRLFTQETVRAKDGKYRYLRHIRAGIYKKIVNWIKMYDPGLPIYFCMETPVVWKDVFGKLPFDIPNLKGIFGAPVKPVRLT